MTVRPLKHSWPGVWSIANWYDPTLFEGRVFAVGLDTLFVGDLSEIGAYDGPRAGIRDFYDPNSLASGVMTWVADETADVYADFCANAGAAMANYGRHDPWLRERHEFAFLQDEFLGQIVSFKEDCRFAITENARIMCFHGNPRPSDPAAGYAHHMWKSFT